MADAHGSRAKGIFGARVRVETAHRSGNHSDCRIFQLLPIQSKSLGKCKGHERRNNAPGRGR